MKALIFNQIVTQLEEEEFPVSSSFTWMDAPTDCIIGWILEDGVLTAPDAIVMTYSENRALEYPSNGDQWDMIYKDNLNSTTTHKDAVEAVKTKWPKDNSGPVE